MKRTPRPLALAALVLAAAGLTGCSELSEQTTTLQYAPADGTEITLDDGVAVRNALFLASDADSPGTLVATVVNFGDQDAVVTISGEGIDGRLSVPAGESVTIGPDGDEEILVDAMGGRPGELVDVELATEQARDVLAVPVLDGTQPEFADLVPTAESTQD